MISSKLTDTDYQARHERKKETLIDLELDIYEKIESLRRVKFKIFIMDPSDTVRLCMVDRTTFFFPI